jgi:hypothetical protein
MYVFSCGNSESVSRVTNTLAIHDSANRRAKEKQKTTTPSESNSLALTLLVPMPATFTPAALAFLPPLLHQILATVLFLDTLVMWRFLVPDVKPCHSSITLSARSQVADKACARS